MKIILLLIFLIFIIFISTNLVSAEVHTLGTFKTNQCVTLKQTCGNCTYVNFTLSTPPNQSTYLANQSMTKISQTLFTYDFCNTSIDGEYTYDTSSDPNGIITPDPVNFFVNPLGKTLTNSQAILYFLIFIISFILFLISLIFGIYVPGGNSKDQMTGYIIAISNIKYVKIFMLAVSYIILMLMTYFGWIISFGYLDLDFLGNLFNFTFYVLIVFMFPLFVIGTYVLISNLVKDAKVGDMLSRGLKIK